MYTVVYLVLRGRRARGEHRAAAKAYGDAIAAAAFEIGQLAMDLAEPDDANPGGAQAPGPGMVPGKLKEVCVACHANRAACYLALAEGEGERPSLALQLAGETEQLACIVPEFGAQAAALEALRTLPLAQAAACTATAAGRISTTNCTDQRCACLSSVHGWLVPRPKETPFF